MKPERYHRMIAVVTVMASTAWGVVVNDFGRYEIILQRRPFGEAPAAAEGNMVRKAAVVPTGPSFVDSLTMCAITSGGGAVRVGFWDTKARPPKTYFLFVGESEDGIQVVSADYEAETVTLEKDGDTRVLNMGGGVVSVGAISSPKPGRMNRRHRIAIRKSTLTRKRYEEERALGIRKAPVSPRRALHGKTSMNDIPADVRQLAMRKYNMELIRAGGSKGVPLPIPLSDAEDAQLVSEGVLPPIVK
jgi:hypothetical protein